MLDNETKPTLHKSVHIYASHYQREFGKKMPEKDEQAISNVLNFLEKQDADFPTWEVMKQRLEIEEPEPEVSVNITETDTTEEAILLCPHNTSIDDCGWCCSVDKIYLKPSTHRSITEAVSKNPWMTEKHRYDDAIHILGFLDFADWDFTDQKVKATLASAALEPDTIRYLKTIVQERIGMGVKEFDAILSQCIGSKSGRLRCWDDMRDLPIEEISWVIQGLFARKSVSFMGGFPKSGKSTQGRYQAYCVTNGRMYLNRFLVNPTNVLYFCLEDAEDLFRAEYRDLEKSLGRADDAKKLYIWDNGIDYKTLLEVIEEMATEHDVGFFIFDTAIKALNIEDTNNYSQVNAAMEPILQLAKDLDFHGCFLHHNTKGGDGRNSKSMMGSTGFAACSGTNIIISGEGDKPRTVTSDNRYSARRGGFTFSGEQIFCNADGSFTLGDKLEDREELEKILCELKVIGFAFHKLHSGEIENFNRPSLGELIRSEGLKVSKDALDTGMKKGLDWGIFEQRQVGKQRPYFLNSEWMNRSVEELEAALEKFDTGEED